MRLSHRDFRPPKRSRYVAAELARNQFAPPRRRPTLRILLLIAFGGLVYLKYDDFVQSGLAKRLKEPKALADSLLGIFRTPEVTVEKPSVLGPGVLAGTWVRSCRAMNGDSCLAAWTSPETELGEARALLARARLHPGLPPADSFAFLFSASDLETPSIDSAMAPELAAGTIPANLTLSGLHLHAGSRRFSWSRRPEGLPGTTPWCLAEGSSPPDCPPDPRPSAPLTAPAVLEPGRPPVAAFAAPPGSPVHSALSGEVVELPIGPDSWLVLRHSSGLLSFYAGLARLRKGLAEGGAVMAGEVLGFTADLDSLSRSEAVPASPSTQPLRFRVERSGSPEDPLAFLGLEAGGGAPESVPVPVPAPVPHAP